MPTRDIVCLGCSAGGVEALQGVLGALPADLPAALLVVMHVVPDSPGMLANVLGRSGPLPAMRAADREALERGHIYVAPPDHHLTVEDGHARVIDGPRDNLHRPSVDVLFRSAAAACGPRVIGVVLSGALDDGTVGLASIKRRGGVAMVQDPNEALFPGMPSSALANVPVDHVATAAGIAALLGRLTREQITVAVPPTSDPTRQASMLTCPECNGSLWEVDDGGALQYRCHVGHTMGVETLLAGQHETRERALWAAIRSLHEQSMLARRIAARARDRGHASVAARFDRQAAQHEDHAEQIRVICSQAPPPHVVP